MFFAAPQDRDAIRALFERERAELEQVKAAYAEQEAEVRRQYTLFTRYLTVIFPDVVLICTLNEPSPVRPSVFRLVC
ncbi:hypothetical protein [Paenibacillus thiaminolyticus]|uniref:hypothetical protein n=1 Tax=Paenibacillus thiaminolyticus TaxID=49283 RepID=UPI003D6CACF1